MRHGKQIKKTPVDAELAGLEENAKMHRDEIKARQKRRHRTEEEQAANDRQIARSEAIAIELESRIAQIKSAQAER